MRGRFATPGLFYLLDAACFLYVLFRHPLRRRHYATLGFSAAELCFLALGAALGGPPWVMAALGACVAGLFIASAVEDGMEKSRARKEAWALERAGKKERALSKKRKMFQNN